MALVEVCVEALAEAEVAEAGGAARIELTANLDVQGTTPPSGLLASCSAHLHIPVMAMIRPRGGSFVYSPRELASMCEDVAHLRGLGARGIVTGALTPEATIDVDAMRQLVGAAGPLPVTFHRAFDAIRDRDRALETLVDLGVARVLTSGGAVTAVDGLDGIARLVQRAAGRITVMAGGGVRAHNVRQVIGHTGVTEVHAHVTAMEAVVGLVRAAEGASPAPAGRTSGGSGA